jgi:hypothetical protein
MIRRLAPLIAIAFCFAASCAEVTEKSPCARYRAALVEYAKRCEPIALPAGGDPASIECKGADELADAGGASLDLAQCTTLIQEHTDPCVRLLWVRDPNATGIQRDEQANLRAELQACAREPIADFSPAHYENDCAAWRDAVTRYAECDPIAPGVTPESRCVEDAALPDGRTVRGCAELIWERTSWLCSVPLGAEREHCLAEVLAK